MKRNFLAGAAVFFVGLFLFFPYREFYRFMLGRIQIPLYYKDLRANAFSIELRCVKINTSGMEIPLGDVSLNWNPLGYFWGDLAVLKLDKGEIHVKNKGDYLFVHGELDPSGLKKFIPVEPGKRVEVRGKFKLSFKSLKIVEFLLKDGFTLKLSGYLSGDKSEIVGFFDIGGVKKSFRWRG